MVETRHELSLHYTEISNIMYAEKTLHSQSVCQQTFAVIRTTGFLQLPHLVIDTLLPVNRFYEISQQFISHLLSGFRPVWPESHSNTRISMVLSSDKLTTSFERFLMSE